MNLDEYKANDYCAWCGESPDSATHLFPFSNYHEYLPPVPKKPRLYLVPDREKSGPSDTNIPEREGDEE